MLSVIMLDVIMLCAVMLNAAKLNVAFMLRVVELRVIMLTVMAPCSMLENDGRLAFLQHKRKTATINILASFYSGNGQHHKQLYGSN